MYEFSMAQQLTSFVHVRSNVKQKLHTFNITAQVSIEVIDEKFGKQLGTTYMEGLVDA